MKLDLLFEGHGRVYKFRYDKFNQDSRPRLLILGKWRHPNTGNILLGGINLNYLSDEQLLALRRNLKDILKHRSLKLRYWAGKKLLPDIFDNYYRTYNRDSVSQVTRDTIKFYTADKDVEQPELLKTHQMPPHEPVAVEPPEETQDKPKGLRKPIPTRSTSKSKESEGHTPGEQQEADETGKATLSKVEPEMEKETTTHGLQSTAKTAGSQTSPSPSSTQEKEHEEAMTSAQRRRLQALNIKREVDRQVPETKST